MIYLHHFGKYLPRRARVSDQIQEDLKEEEAPVEESLEEEEPKKKRKLWPFGKKNKEAKNDDETSEEADSESQ